MCAKKMSSRLKDIKSSFGHFLNMCAIRDEIVVQRSVILNDFDKDFFVHRIEMYAGDHFQMIVVKCS